jgi:hypothetical protein
MLIDSVIGKRHPRGCRAEFDYTGWSNYNIWRREVRRILAERKGLAPGNNNGSHLKGRWDSDETLPLTPRWNERNCWVDCSFPSECHNYRAQLLREKALFGSQQKFLHEEMRKKEREEEVEVEFKNIHWQENEKESAGELNEEELKSLYLNMVVKSSDEGDIQIQDCDGLGEEGYRLEYTKSKRRKSIEAHEGIGGIGQEPNSPLKEECGEDWGKEEGRLWQDIDLDDDDDDDDEDGPRGRTKNRGEVDEEGPSTICG